MDDTWKKTNYPDHNIVEISCVNHTEEMKIPKVHKHVLRMQS